MLGQKSRRGKEGQDLLDPLQVSLAKKFPNRAKLEELESDDMFLSVAATAGFSFQIG